MTNVATRVELVAASAFVVQVYWAPLFDHSIEIHFIGSILTGAGLKSSLSEDNPFSNLLSCARFTE